jgi:hypothetical protein
MQLQPAALHVCDVCLRVVTTRAVDAFVDELENLLLDGSLINARWHNNVAAFVDFAR